MGEKNQPEFTLEDILKEFGSEPLEPAPAQPPARQDKPSTPTQPEEPVWEFLPRQEFAGDAPEDAPQAPEDPEEAPGETQEIPAENRQIFDENPNEEPDESRFAEPEVQTWAPTEDPTDAPESGMLEEDTIRLDTRKILAAIGEQPDDETQVFSPVEEAPEQPAADTIPEGAEPFGTDWEPEYEQPIGEYTPPEPIVFRPRSQLRDLKRKLVAGPERRYYALAEQGLGKLQISIFLSVIVVLLGSVSVGLYHFGMIPQERMRLLVFGEIFAMLFAALLASNCLLNGIVSLFKGRFTLDTLLVASFLVCMADGYFCLRQVRVPFCAAFCLQACMSLWAESQRRSTEMGQMDTLRKATQLKQVAKAPGCYGDDPGFYVTAGEPEDFMDTYQQPSGGDRLVRIYALTVFLVTAAIAGFTGFTRGLSDAMQVWSACILAAAPATIFICQSRPMAVLERRLHRLGAVLCGWQGIKACAGAAAVPLTDGDLFPAGSVKINGVKFYTNREPDQVIAYAAALIHCSGNCLSPLFEELLDQRSGHHYDVENFRSYEAGGMGGELDGESVLVGTLPFLKDMGVETPEGARVNQAVYLSIDGELCAVFALAFGKLKGVSAGLGTLCSYRGLTPVLSSDNFLLSEGFLRAKFNVNTRRMAFPSLQERQKVASWTPAPTQSIPCALLTQDSLAASAFSITGARAYHTASMLGAIVHIFGGILGVVIVAALALVAGGSLLTPANLLLFELIWAVPGLLITEWTRNI